MELDSRDPGQLTSKVSFAYTDVPFPRIPWMKQSHLDVRFLVASVKLSTRANDTEYTRSLPSDSSGTRQQTHLSVQ